MDEKIVIIGLGYVGLPVAMRACAAGMTVVGLDLDEDRIARLQAAESYVDDVTDTELAAARESGTFEASSDYAAAADFSVAVITVPTPLREGQPDLRFIESAARSIGSRITPGATVILESTTYPGTTEELVVPILERESGMRAGLDFFIGYSPERIDPGNTEWTFARTPKIVAGLTPECLDRVRAFYDRLVDTTVPVSGLREAELAKLLENTFRHVNIALVNELAVFAHQLGVNVWDAIDAAASKPFGFMRFTPGPGVGGHCLPVDPSYLSWQVQRRLGQNFRFVELANDVNNYMPDYVVQRVMHLLNESGIALRGARVLLVGLSYKRNSGDIRESPAMRVRENLEGFGAITAAVDPLIAERYWPAGLSRAELSAATLRDYDVGILLTDHDRLNLTVLEGAALPVLDTRNRLRGENIDPL